MNVVVQKYGGSSMADVACINRVADRIAASRSAGDSVVVVVSAMGKTTDQLLALARQISPSAPRRELDMLVSTGERVSMAALAIALDARGVDAISFTGSQSGIITNDRHFDARIIEVRPFRIEDELVRGRVVIVAGYQGMSYRREITTLGRGGSDTTAVALAAALSAARCEIYSDVDGVYSADPRVVSDAAHLGELGYETLQEMAEAGAKVLNADAVAFARKHKIAIFARRTSDAVGDPARRETVVSDGALPHSRSVLAVVGDKAIAEVCASGVDPASIDSLLAHCAALDVPLRELNYDGATLWAWVPLARVPDWSRARQELKSKGCEVFDAASDCQRGCVSLIGHELTQDPTVLRAMLSIAAEHNARVHRLSVASLRLTVSVNVSWVDDLTRALHARFCSV